MDHPDGKGLLYFANINEPLQMLVDLRAAVDKKIIESPYLKDELIKRGALMIVGEELAATTAGCAIYARLNPTNNFTLAVVLHNQAETV